MLPEVMTKAEWCKIASYKLGYTYTVSMHGMYVDFPRCVPKLVRTSWKVRQAVWTCAWADELDAGGTSAHVAANELPRL
jgi:hypothetical protein